MILNLYAPNDFGIGLPTSAVTFLLIATGAQSQAVEHAFLLWSGIVILLSHSGGAGSTTGVMRF